MAKEVHFPDPPRGHIAVVGWDAANARWQAVAVDSSGLLQVDLADVVDRQVNAHGYDGSAWRKLPILWGFSSAYGDVNYNQNMPAGASNVNLAAIASGQVVRAGGASLYVASATCTDMRVYAHIGAQDICVADQLTPTSGQVYPFPFDVVLDAADYLYGRFYGMTLNDDAWIWAWGYQMGKAM